MSSSKLENLERTILEVGTEIYRIRHRMDEVDKDNKRFKQLFASLRSLLDDKGIVSREDFDEMVDLDAIIDRQNPHSGMDTMLASDNQIKKLAN